MKKSRQAALGVALLALGATVASASTPLTTSPSPVIAWEQNGNVTVDGFQRLFISGQTHSSLSRVDASDGRPLWTLPEDSSVSASCAFKDTLFRYVKASGLLTALFVDNGEQRWQQPVADQLAAVSSVKLICDEQLGLAYLHIGTDAGYTDEVRRFDPATGATLWKQVGDFDSILKLTSEGPIVAVRGKSLRGSGGNLAKLQRLDAHTGVTAWSIDAEKSDVTLQQDDTAYTSAAGAITRIDTRSGAQIFRSATKSFSTAAFTPDAAYVSDQLADGALLKKLDAATGQVLWQQQLAKGSSIALILPLGNAGTAVKVVTQDGLSLRAYSQDGQLLWEQSSVEGKLFLSQAGQLYLQTRNNLQQLSLATGTVNWSYQRPGAPGDGPFPGGFAKDSLESNSRLYLRYSLGGYREDAGGGVVAIDQRTGVVAWRYVTDQRMVLSGQTDRVVLVTEGLMGSIEVKAIPKYERRAHIE